MKLMLKIAIENKLPSEFSVQNVFVLELKKASAKRCCLGGGSLDGGLHIAGGFSRSQEGFPPSFSDEVGGQIDLGRSAVSDFYH